MLSFFKRRDYAAEANPGEIYEHHPGTRYPHRYYRGDNFKNPEWTGRWFATPGDGGATYIDDDPPWKPLEIVLRYNGSERLFRWPNRHTIECVDENGAVIERFGTSPKYLREHYPGDPANTRRSIPSADFGNLAEMLWPARETGVAEYDVTPIR